MSSGVTWTAWTTVVAGGVVRVEGGRHVLGDVGAMLETAIRAAWEEGRCR